MYKLRVSVEKINGFCDLPMKVGDYFEVEGSAIIVPKGSKICLWALQSMMPFFPAKQRAKDDSNDWIPMTSRFVCPDPNGGVIFKIEKVDPKTKKIVDDGNSNADKFLRIMVDAEKCTGCRSCELACSFGHERMFSPEFSRIKVYSDEETGEDTINVCRQCGNAPCVEVCPVDALSKNELGAIILNEEKCVKCGLCAKACPFDAISFHFDKKVPLICDLCGGDPECVSICPTNAITFDMLKEKL